MSKRRYPNNALALAIANYTKVVNDCFGGMSDPYATVDPSNESEAQNG